MKHHTTLITALLAGALALPALSAQATPRSILPLAAPTGADPIPVDTAAMSREGRLLAIHIRLRLSELEMKSREAVVLTPRLVGATDTVTLPSVGVYGRRRYYYQQRHVRTGGAITGPTETTFRRTKAPDSYDYTLTTPWQDWMENSCLILRRQDYGCCNRPGEGADSILTCSEAPEVYTPVFNFITPHDVQATVKTRSLSGSALITFPVNQTVIRPDYRDNTRELDKIATTINSVKSDADMTILGISLKGYASPEGGYKSNERLARGRVAALEDYVSRVFGIADSLISTDYEAENWAGLRAYVAQSPLQHRADILAIIDSDDDPDAKEARIKRSYPDDYRHLLLNCYPALRLTDYRVDYVIRSYTEVDEIRRLIEVDPSRLSVEEFYLAAQGLDPQSAEYERVFTVAVQQYPDDPVCNLNAANFAMRRGDLEQAATYLARAGRSPEAEQAREVYQRLLQEQQP